MHGHVNEAEFLSGISGLLGGFYLLLAVMNALAAFYLWRSGRSQSICGPVTTIHLWLLVAGIFTVFAPIAMSGDPYFMKLVSFPEFVEKFIDSMTNAVVYTVGTLAVLLVLYFGRKFFTKPVIAWACLNLSFCAMGFAITNPNFALIVTKPDNVPIVGMVFLLGFFTWLSGRRAVQNDERFKQGLEPLEKLDNEKVLVWPDLVYTELICMVAITAVLLLWGIALQAPLEEMASTVKTPNPSKAPWYFLGLQEMLVYFDPWMAGVVLPSMIVFGLMAVPYIDYNKAGNGYYTIDQRKFAYLTFQFGFLGLWVTLIILGTFLRGPNWNIFGPFEIWDSHKVEALNNVDLSEYFWNSLGKARPKAPNGSGEFTKIGYILWREFPGFALVIGYFAVVPPAMAVFSKFFRNMFLRMGFIRFMVMTNLLLTMFLLPIKMIMRWSFNMKYFIAIPEYLTNL